MIKRVKGSPALPLSAARAQLFRLVDDLLAGRTDRVALSRRGHDEEVLLVRAHEFERMQAEVAALRARVAPEPRSLFGMGHIVGPTDDPLADGRTHQNTLFEAKMRDIFGHPVSPDRPDEPAPNSGIAVARRRSGGRRRGKP